jgi:hypothetical protein
VGCPFPRSKVFLTINSVEKKRTKDSLPISNATLASMEAK